jgi:hypothetical protein
MRQIDADLEQYRAEAELFEVGFFRCFCLEEIFEFIISWGDSYNCLTHFIFYIQ